MKKRICSAVLCLAFVLSYVSLFGAVSVNQTFTYSDPDWGKGENTTSDGLWVYEWFDRESDTFAHMDWSDEGYFASQFSEASASDVHWYCRIRTNGKNLHPGAQADAVKTFVCPEDGKIQVSITCQRQSDVAENNNGNTVRLMLNEQIVPIDGEEEIMLDDRTALEIEETIEVEKGDSLRFMIGSQGNSNGDGVDVPIHNVTYLSGENLESEKPSFTVTCVGDSVTEGMQTSGGLKGSDAFPAVLEKLLNDSGVGVFTVNNCGKSATTAQKAGDVPYKESAEYRSSLKTDPDVVIIGLGANDSKKVNWNAERYEADLQSLILEYMNLESKPTVYLMYTTYVADQSKTGCQRSVIQNKILPIQKTIAEDLGLKIIDLNTLTKKNATKYADGVHPNDELQSMMAEYIFNAFCSEGVGGLTAENATATVAMIDPAAEQEPIKTDSDTDTASPTESESSETESSPSSLPSTDATDVPAQDYGWVLWVCIAAGIVIIGAVAVILLLRNKK